MSDAPGPITPDSIRFDGRVAVITGAAQGIGQATALTLAGLGARVAVCDKLEAQLADTVDQLESVGVEPISALMDVRDVDSVTAFAAAVADECAAVDVVVNNAGGGFYSRFLDTSPKGQAALVDENFTQVTSFVRSFVPLMTGGGSIVNVTSIEGHRAGPGFGIYSAMKAAVANLSKTLALELAEQRIRVNCVAPDMIPTPGDAGLVEASGAMGGELTYDQPWPDGGTTWDAANAIVFLASGLSGFVTGTTLHVDGGTHAASGWKANPEGSGWTL